MTNQIEITFINRTRSNPNPSTIIVCVHNDIPQFEVSQHGIVWQAIKRVGYQSSYQFNFQIQTHIQAAWHDGARTQILAAELGQAYQIHDDTTGIILSPQGIAHHANTIELHNRIKTPNGIQAHLYKGNKIILSQANIAYNQKATFKLKPRLYWGIALDAELGQAMHSVFLSSDHFFSHDIEDSQKITVTLTGDLKNGYQFDAQNHT